MTNDRRADFRIISTGVLFMSVVVFAGIEARAQRAAACYDCTGVSNPAVQGFGKICDDGCEAEADGPDSGNAEMCRVLKVAKNVCKPIEGDAGADQGGARQDACYDCRDSSNSALQGFASVCESDCEAEDRNSPDSANSEICRIVALARQTCKPMQASIDGKSREADRRSNDKGPAKDVVAPFAGAIKQVIDGSLTNPTFDQ